MSSPETIRIQKLTAQILTLNEMIAIYDQEGQQERVARKNLERQITNLQVQLELLEKKRERFVRVDQFLLDLSTIERDRDFAAELGVCGPTFSLAALIQSVISGDSVEAWKAIEGYRTRVTDFSCKMTDLERAKQPEVVSRISAQALATPIITEQMIKQRVDAELEDRVRTLVRELYEQAIGLPHRIRQIYTAFSRDRSEFQDVLHARKSLTDDLMQKHRLDAKFSILRDGMQKCLPLNQPEDVSELESLIRLACSSLVRLNELDEQATTIGARIEQHKADYRLTNEEASGLWDRAASIKGYCSLFALPIPAEVDRQVDHAKRELSFVNPRSEESARIGNMNLYQTTFPERPKALKDFLATALPLAEALLLKVRKLNPEDLFQDKCSRNNAHARLFMIASDVCNKPESNMFRGYKGKKTLVGSVLASGLISPRDADAFALVPDQLKNLYDMERFKFSWLWKPKPECLALARQFLQDSPFADAIRAAILDGQAIYKETAAAERKEKAAVSL